MSENEETVSYATHYRQKGSTIVNVRVPQALIMKMEMWVENEEFKSRSEFVVSAVRHHLDYLATRKTPQEVESHLNRTFSLPKIKNKLAFIFNDPLEKNLLPNTSPLTSWPLILETLLKIA